MNNKKIQTSYTAVSKWVQINYFVESVKINYSADTGHVHKTYSADTK